MKAVLYCRISTGERSKFSLEAQEDGLRRYCRERRTEVFKVYKDKKSALDFEKREGLQETLSV